MSQRQHILIVAPNHRLARTLVSWLGSDTRTIETVSTFAAAKVRLETMPDLVVTELKLNDHNGLHLALWAQVANIPVIVIGPDDIVLEKDALALGASYLTAPSREQLLSVVESLSGATSATVRDRSRWSETSGSSALPVSESLTWMTDARHSHQPPRRPLLH